ncbi:MAG TPA: amidohydrolase [Rhizomicrobium sp.]|nr:amidohydrolase [Rhizomicrobium sp.]
MSLIGRLTIAAVCVVSGLFVGGAAMASEPADTIFVHGTIATMDPARPWADAMAIRKGRIVSLGKDVDGFRGPHTKVIDLGGRFVMPGFHDAHAHPMSSGMQLLRCRVAGNSAQVTGALKACDRERRNEQWLIASGWVPRTAPADLARLDALVPDKPAFVATQDGFTAWVNTKALRAAGIDPRAAQVTGLERDAKTRVATGVVTGDALDRVRAARPVPSSAEYRAAFAAWSAMANRFGVVSVFDASITPAMAEAYHAADRAGALTLRVVGAQNVDTARGVEQIPAMIALRDRVRGPMFNADAAKIFLDGEIEMHTAAVLADYADLPGSRGAMLVSPARLDVLVQRLDRAGFMIHMHAMGDAAVRHGLDAIARAERANGPRDRRHQLAHLALVDPADVPRFAQLGVTANFQPLWFQADDPATAGTDHALTPRLRQSLYPIARIAAAHARIVASSDWPSTSINPLEAIQAAITRQPLDGSKPARQPDQRMTLAAMLAAYTRDAAWVAGEDRNDGTQAVGKAADLIVLDRNLFQVKSGDLRTARVLLTMLNGREVYRSGI